MEERRSMKTGLTLHRTLLRSAAWLAVGVLACGSVDARAGTSTIYKCFDRSLGVLYTDQPCKGEQLEIRAGDADPNAVAALERERDALSRSMAQRIADQRRATLDTQRTVEWAYPTPADPGIYAANDVYYPVGWGFAPYGTAKPPRQADRRPDERRDRAPYVPNPPRGLPRR
jgi:hypothetical protein